MIQEERDMIADVAMIKNELAHLNEDLRDHMDGEEEKVRKVHRALLGLGMIQLLALSGFTGPEIWTLLSGLF